MLYVWSELSGGTIKFPRIFPMFYQKREKKVTSCHEKSVNLFKLYHECDLNFIVALLRLTRRLLLLLHPKRDGVEFWMKNFRLFPSCSARILSICFHCLFNVFLLKWDDVAHENSQIHFSRPFSLLSCCNEMPYCSTRQTQNPESIQKTFKKKQEKNLLEISRRNNGTRPRRKGKLGRCDLIGEKGNFHNLIFSLSDIQFLGAHSNPLTFYAPFSRQLSNAERIQIFQVVIGTELRNMIF